MIKKITPRALLLTSAMRTASEHPLACLLPALPQKALHMPCTVERTAGRMPPSLLTTCPSTFKEEQTGQICGLGDTVKIIESKPLSKLKRWRVLDIQKKAIN